LSYLTKRAGVTYVRPAAIPRDFWEIYRKEGASDLKTWQFKPEGYTERGDEIHLA
jgi:hypothetical protein